MSSSKGIKELHLAIAATFTAEPVENTLSFWLDTLNIPHVIQFSPYNQVFQQLLDTQSLFAQNQSDDTTQAVNLIFLRLEDWLSGQPAQGSCQMPASTASVTTSASVPQSETADYSATAQTLRQNAADLVNAIKVSSLRGNTQHVLVFCPISEKPAIDDELIAILETTEQFITNQLASAGQVETISQKTILESYPVAKVVDANTARAGHVPYTEAVYTALATTIVRRLTALSRAPYKVIVLDCDNTLWQGVCGEEGPDGVTISAGFESLQRFMLTRKDAGMLLCLASKNIEGDVFAVFDQNTNMVLQRSDIVAARINWQPKSENLKSLAQELNLGLDSFIFIDDNPVECAEVRAHCPQVATFQLPADSQLSANENAIEQFLQHIWLLDGGQTTEEDKKRAERYQQNAQREQARSEATTLKDFLQSLNLVIDIQKPKPEHLPRIAQLTQRTNQFNTTTIRRTETEIRDLLQQGSLHAAVAHVSDKFGDYGLVGVLLYGISDTAIQVDSLILSCRALGRSVEQSMAKYLAEQAHANGLQSVEVAFSPTERNEPAHIFLETVGTAEKAVLDHGTIYRYKTAEWLQIVPMEAATPSAAASSKTDNSATKTAGPAPGVTAMNGVTATNGITATKTPTLEIWQHIATTLNSAEKIKRTVQNCTRPRPSLQSSFIEPQTANEKKVAQIWQDVLGIEGIGLEDGFKELGGSSLQLVQIYGRLLDAFDTTLPFTALFGLPTIRSFIEHLDAKPDTGNQALAIKQRAARQKAAMQRRRKLQLNLR